jgi:hypothetical protein
MESQANRSVRKAQTSIHERHSFATEQLHSKDKTVSALETYLTKRMKPTVCIRHYNMAKFTILKEHLHQYTMQQK